MLPYLLILITVIGNVIALLLVKKAVVDAGQIPKETGELISFFIKMLTNFYTWLAVLAVFIGLLAFWLILTRIELSRVYPIIGGISYILVALCGVMLFKENVTVLGWLGILMVAAGVILLFHN